MITINQINEIQGVSTKDINIFNLNELYIDDIHVGYVRVTNDKIEILPHVNFAVNITITIFVNLDEFNDVIDQFKVKDIIAYDRSKSSQAASTPNTKANQLATPNLIGLKVFGNWGVNGFDYGIIINEYSDSCGKDIVIEWENGNTKQIDVNEVIAIDEHTDIHNIGYYIDVTGEYLGKDVAIVTENDTTGKGINEVNTNHTPGLEHFSGSWVVSRIKDGSVIGEFYERSNAERFNPEVCIIETSLQYLQRTNQRIKEGSNTDLINKNILKIIKYHAIMNYNQKRDT